MTVVRGEVVIDHADFLNSLFVGNDRRFVEAVAHDRESVQLNIIFKGAAAVHADGRKLRAAGDADAEGVESLTVRGFVPRLHAVLQGGVVERILGDVGNDVDYLGTDSRGNA